MSLVDDNGNQKWNTKAEDEQAAKEYIKKIISNDRYYDLYKTCS